jgi:hypothetical protein
MIPAADVKHLVIMLQRSKAVLRYLEVLSTDEAETLVRVGEPAKERRGPAIAAVSRLRCERKNAMVTYPFGPRANERNGLQGFRREALWTRRTEGSQRKEGILGWKGSGAVRNWAPNTNMDENERQGVQGQVTERRQTRSGRSV